MTPKRLGEGILTEGKGLGNILYDSPARREQKGAFRYENALLSFLQVM